MGQVLGADPDQLDGLAQAMSASAERLDTMRSTVTSALAYTQWEGGDADDFRWQWHHQLTGLLHGVSNALREEGRMLHTNAEQQRGASGADGGHQAGYVVGGAWCEQPRGGFDLGSAAFGAMSFLVAGLSWLAAPVGILEDARQGSLPGFKKFADGLVAKAPSLGIAGKLLGPLGLPLDVISTLFSAKEVSDEVGKNPRSREAFDAGVDLAFNVAGLVTTTVVVGALAAGVAASAPVVVGAAVVGLAVVGLGLGYEAIKMFNPDLHEQIHQGFTHAADGVGHAVEGAGNAIHDGVDAASRVIFGGVNSLLGSL